MADQSPLSKLADELDALVVPGAGTAYGVYHDESMVEVVADRDALVFIAAAFARTAARAEAAPDTRETGPFTDAVFKTGSDLYLWFPTYAPEPRPPQEQESDWKSRAAQASLKAGCFLFVLLAVVGLITVVRWVL